MRKLILVTAGLLMLTVTGLAVAHGFDNAKSVKAVAGTFTATTVGNSQTRSCTTADGKAITSTNATYTGTASGDADLTGAITLQVHSTINTTDGVGVLNGRLKIAATGGDTSAHFDAVYDHGTIAGSPPAMPQRRTSRCSGTSPRASAPRAGSPAGRSAAARPAAPPSSSDLQSARPRRRSTSGARHTAPSRPSPPPRSPSAGSPAPSRLTSPRRWARSRSATGQRSSARSSAASTRSSRSTSSAKAPGTREEGSQRGPSSRHDRYAVAVIVMPPRAFCSSVTRTFSAGSSTASATSSRILTASASPKTALVAEPVQVELERLRLDAQPAGPVLDARHVHVGLPGDRTHRGQLVARQLDVGDAGVRERLEACVVL